MRPARRALIIVSAILAGLSLGACRSGLERPRIETTAPYDGPPVSFSATSRTHVAVISAPTPGWTVEFEVAEPTFDRDHAFITLRRPRPGLALAQVVVDHSIDTGVALTRPVGVFIRVLDADAEKSGVPFRPAGERDPASP